MLSGGQQQRVALARALAPAPKVLLLDEPFSGLDVTLRREVRDQTLHVLKSAGVATLMVTHDPEEAMFMADRIALMRAGRLEQVGPPSALYFQPLNRFVAGFFGEVNVMPGQVVGGAVATPLGPVPAPGFPEGAAVEVLIRSEGLLLGALAVAGSQRQIGSARVLAARLLGRTSLVHLELDRAGEEPLHLHARVPGRFLPAEQSAMPVAIDPGLAFVFAAPAPT
jgi:iron(III) transport system ATP-binding protein